MTKEELMDKIHWHMEDIIISMKGKDLSHEYWFYVLIGKLVLLLKTEGHDIKKCLIPGEQKDLDMKEK